MKLTHAEKKMIRAYFGHNGVECRVKIKNDGTVLRHGHPESTNRSADVWIYLGEAADLLREISTVKEMAKEYA